MSDENGRQADNRARAGVMAEALAVAGDLPTPQLRSLVCPYCGTVTPDSGRCGHCGGRFDPLSRQATQNQMGPWVIRDERMPFRPGCTYDTLIRLAELGKISTETVLRGPSTRQFWMLARHTPGVAHRLGLCHNCQSEVKPDAFSCPACHAPFTVERDRQHLGLGPARPLPGQGLPGVLAMHAEPASVPGGGAIASAPMPRSPQSAAADPDSRAGEAGAAALKQIEEANRLAKRWRAESAASRRNAWVVIVLACVISLIALFYASTRG